MKPSSKAAEPISPAKVLEICQEIVDLFHSLAGIPTKVETHTKDWSTIMLDGGSVYGSLFIVSRRFLQFQHFDPTYERGMALRTQKIPHDHPKRNELLQSRILQIVTLVNRSRSIQARFDQAMDAQVVLQRHGIPSHADRQSGSVKINLLVEPEKAVEIAAGLAAFLTQHGLLTASVFGEPTAHNEALLATMDQSPPEPAKSHES